ncbi:hypothetical protein QTP88_014770 [Uroleucon formosanum]
MQHIISILGFCIILTTGVRSQRCNSNTAIEGSAIYKVQLFLNVFSLFVSQYMGLNSSETSLDHFLVVPAQRHVPPVSRRLDTGLRSKLGCTKSSKLFTGPS